MRHIVKAIIDHKQNVLGISFIFILAGGWLYYPIGYFLLVCMAGAIGLSFTNGRNWCDWLCPRGSFYDAIKNLSRGKKVPSFFKHTALRLFMITLMMTVLTFQLIPVWGDFYLMGKPFVMLLTVTTIIGITLGFAYKQRIWCVFCPMGTIANFIGGKKNNFVIDSNSCIDCQRCADACRMEIDPSTYRDNGFILDGDCLRCSQCIESCKTGAIFNPVIVQ